MNPYMAINSAYAQARHGKGRKFEWDTRENGGQSVFSARKLLEQYGVGVYAIIIDDPRSSLRVNDAQADFAESILRTANVPITNEVKAEALAEMPAKRGGYAKSKDPIGALQSAMANALGMGYKAAPVELSKREQRAGITTASRGGTAAAKKAERRRGGDGATRTVRKWLRDLW